jgi:hypothetical protein
MDDITWTQAFTTLLDHDVKLAGSSINCERTHWRGDLEGQTRHNAHVQSYALATDR